MIVIAVVMMVAIIYAFMLMVLCIFMMGNRVTEHIENKQPPLEFVSGLFYRKGCEEISHLKLLSISLVLSLFVFALLVFA